MVKKFAMLFVFLFFCSKAFSIYNDDFVINKETTAKAIFDNDGRIKNELLVIANSQISKMPSALKIIFANKKINFFILLDNGSNLGLCVKTNEEKITEIYNKTMDDADLEVKVKESTIAKIIKAPDPTKEIVKSIANGEITYNGLTSKDKINSFIVKVSAKIFVFFENFTKKLPTKKLVD